MQAESSPVLTDDSCICFDCPIIFQHSDDRFLCYDYCFFETLLWQSHAYLSLKNKWSLSCISSEKFIYEMIRNDLIQRA